MGASGASTGVQEQPQGKQETKQKVSVFLVQWQEMGHGCSNFSGCLYWQRSGKCVRGLLACTLLALEISTLWSKLNWFWLLKQPLFYLNVKNLSDLSSLLGEGHIIVKHNGSILVWQDLSVVTLSGLLSVLRSKEVDSLAQASIFLFIWLFACYIVGRQITGWLKC